MWNWIKKIIKFFNKKEQEKIKKRVDYSNMNLGDLKKLKAEGKIKDIYPPYI